MPLGQHYQINGQINYSPQDSFAQILKNTFKNMRDENDLLNIKYIYTINYQYYNYHSLKKIQLNNLF